MTIAGEPESVSVTRAGAVATITVGSGAHLNAMSRAEWRALDAAATALAADESVAAVVVRGRGGRFSAGSNLNDWNGVSAAEVDASFTEIEAALQAVEDLPMPTVAVVEGVAAGGGCQLLLSCDLQLVARSARLGMPTARLGILVPPSFANRLSLRVGPSRAKDLLFGGDLLSAEQASAIGLVTRVIADDELDAELGRLLERWGTQSAAALRAAKSAVNLGLAPLEQPARERVLAGVSDPGEFAGRVNGFLHRSRPAH